MTIKREKMNNSGETVAIASLGCAKNLVNTEQMLFLLKEAGYQIIDYDAGSEGDGCGHDVKTDIVVINTCGFIEGAKTEAIDTILEFARAKDEGKVKRIIVTGCLPERYKEEILTQLPEIDAVVGTGSFDCIVSAVKGEGVEFFGNINSPVSETKRIITGSSVSAYIKIAEGCDNRCAYCVIPDIRGYYRSREIEKVIDEAQNLADKGYKELILVAQDLTRYGLDRYKKRILPELLLRLCDIQNLDWIRLHYLYPDDIDQHLIDVIAKYDKILKYIDMPIQHINDDILRKMNRRGTGAEIRTLIAKLRSDIPGVVIRTSLITGLPGENNREFEELCDFLRETRIERAGVFAYSAEEGTPAAKMRRPDETITTRRVELLTDIQAEVMDTFSKSRIDDVTPVLIEERAGDVYYGRSYAESPGIDGLITVTGKGISLFDIINVRITGVIDGEPYGVKV